MLFFRLWREEYVRVRREWAQPQFRMGMARYALSMAAVADGARGDERQQVQELQEGEEDREEEQNDAEEKFVAVPERPDDGSNRMLIGPDVDRGEANTRQDDAQRE